MDDLRIEKETPGEIIYVSHFEGLDFISDWKKEHPNEPFFGGAVKKRHQ